MFPSISDEYSPYILKRSVQFELPVFVKRNVLRANTLAFDRFFTSYVVARIIGKLSSNKTCIKIAIKLYHSLLQR